nr:hypothetical protein [Microvirga massiliensis]
MKSAVACEALDKGRWLWSQKDSRGNPALSHFLQGLILSHVNLRHLEAESPEKLACDVLNTAAVISEIDGLAGKIGELPDVLPRDDMQLFVEELGDVDELALEISKLFALLKTGEHVLLCDPHVDARKRENIADVVNPSATDNREDTQRQLSARAGLLPGYQDSRDFIDEREGTPFRTSCDNPDCVRVSSRRGLLYRSRRRSLRECGRWD